MNIALTQRFLSTSHDLKGLLSGCKKMATFVRRTDQQSQLAPDRYDPDSYKGDALELFVEAFIKLSPVDNRIGIGEYQVVEDQDTGVDGFGIGTNGKPATVQVKYRSNSDQVLTANQDHLSNFVTASLLRYKVDPADDKNMLIVTTAKGLHHFTDSEMFQKQVRCIGYDDLRKRVDNNQLFWDRFRDLCGV